MNVKHHKSCATMNASEPENTCDCTSRDRERKRMSTTPRTDEIRNVDYATQGQELLAIYSHAEKLELENIKLLEQNNQLKIDIALIREQHNQEMKEFKSDEALIAENKKLLEVARAAKVLMEYKFYEGGTERHIKAGEVRDTLKSLEESGVKI